MALSVLWVVLFCSFLREKLLASMEPLRINNIIYTLQNDITVSSPGVSYILYTWHFSFCIQKQHHWIQPFPFLSVTLYLSRHPIHSVLHWTNSGFCDLSLISMSPFPILHSSHTGDVPIEGDFINVPPTFPRKSNFLHLSKGYSWNIYRVKIKLDCWNLNNVWILCLFSLQAYKYKLLDVRPYLT